MKTNTHELHLFNNGQIVVTYKSDNLDFFITKINHLNGNPVENLTPDEMNWIHDEIQQHILVENETNEMKNEMMWDQNDEQ